MSTTFIERLQRGPVLCDGAMGTQLHAHGITFEHSLDGLNLTQPEVVLNVHRGYVEAGADLLETNTFGGNRFRLAGARSGRQGRGDQPIGCAAGAQGGR